VTISTKETATVTCSKSGQCNTGIHLQKMYCLKSISKVSYNLRKGLVTENMPFITSERGAALSKKTKGASFAAYFGKYLKL
jgi:hypothetical protein